ncbi:MAG TPA: GntR family transcriptional regulator [Candidatus Binatia bacterium]|nr:GntR family transcriptional regulator [Candidatus Binatia bacterium]
MLRTLKLESTASALAERVREDILQGTFAAGDPLPQEEIAARYGVSRSPLREALRQLESEGWIDYQPNRGAVVATITAKDVRELYAVRHILEEGAIERAIPQLDDARLREAKRIDSELRHTTDPAKAVVLHREFHETIYGALENPRLIEAIFRHHVRAQRLPDPQARIAAVAKASRVDHRVLLEACERRDRRAAVHATREHLNHTEAILLKGLE